METHHNNISNLGRLYIHVINIIIIHIYDEDISV